MKKFLLKIILLLIILVGLDYIAGLGFSYLERNSKGGYTQRDNFICNQLETDILISGSSRCVRHYNPQIITDSLGLTCYNSGQMGNGIILNYGRLRMINERHRPQLIIYDLQPNFDFLSGLDNHRYLTWLKSHYERNGIADIFNSIDKTEKYKMQSKMYRYNSRIIELLADYFHPISNVRNDGFEPLKGKLDVNKISNNGSSTPSYSYSYDTLKISYINKMIEESAGSRLVFVVSPSLNGMDSIQFAPIKEICKEKNIPFINFSRHPKYVHQDVYFKDGSHMNATGANEFTKDLVKYLKKEGIV